MEPTALRMLVTRQSRLEQSSNSQFFHRKLLLYLILVVSILTRSAETASETLIGTQLAIGACVLVFYTYIEKIYLHTRIRKLEELLIQNAGLGASSQKAHGPADEQIFWRDKYIQFGYPDKHQQKLHYLILAEPFLIFLAIIASTFT